MTVALYGMTPSTEVDARNQLCPGPLLTFKKRMKALSSGGTIAIVVNDQTSRANILSYCLGKGDEIIGSWQDGDDFHMIFRKSKA